MEIEGWKDCEMKKRKEFQFFFLSDIIRMRCYKYFISLMIINQLLTKLEKIQNNKELLRKTCKLNQLPITILNGFTNAKINLIYERLVKHYDEHPDKAKTIWFQNELKIFFWIVLCISLFQDKKILEFEDGEWLLIQKYFFKKDLYTFKYEAKRAISSGRKNSRVWNAEENKLLKKIMSDLSLKNKWNEVARIFYAKSDHKYFRTGKQCREHWLNHLDPSKKHGKWTDQEDHQILKYVFQNGKKWSLIAKEIMAHRTQHMIKNRYKALLFKQKKKANSNQHDQNKILKKIIKKFSQIKENSEVQIVKQMCEKEPQNRIQTQIEIQCPEKQVEKSVQQNHVQIPLNNFNFPTNYPWVYIWTPSIQMMNPFNIMNPFVNQMGYQQNMQVVRVNEKIPILQVSNNLKVKTIHSQQTTIQIQGQNIHQQ